MIFSAVLPVTSDGKKCTLTLDCNSGKTTFSFLFPVSVTWTEIARVNAVHGKTIRNCGNASLWRNA